MTSLTTHPDLAVEQSYVDQVHRANDASRQRRLHSAESAPDKFTAREMRRRALMRLRDDVNPEALCFGRIDLERGKTHYLGRGAVHDADGTLLVIDWRRPVAEGFYKATRGEPLGLSGRRRFRLDGDRLLGIIEDRFVGDEAPTTPEDEAERPIDPHVADAILADLDRSRTPEMRDIVATIEARQYELITAGLEGVQAIQGGPGSGKTAIALHRAAWLLLNHHEELEGPGVLVVGPNRAFMEYVRGVLPALGESAVVQLSVDRLTQLEDVRVRGVESRAVARVKSNATMAVMIRRAVAARVRRPQEDIPFTFGSSRIVLPSQTIRSLVEQAWAEGERTYTRARESFRQALIGLVQRLVAELPRRQLSEPSTTGIEAAVTAAGGPLDGIWPTVTAPEVLRDLLNSRQRTAAAGSDLLSAEECAALYRPRARLLREEPWTAADIALLDEAEDALRGPVSPYGYVIVDEAQDLTPMQLRMVLRRSVLGRATLVGDIAQATGPVRYSGWTELADAAGASEPSVHELLLGYRVPRQIMALAAPLHEQVAPDVRLPRAVREGAEEPRVVPVQPHELLSELLTAVGARIEGDRTVGVIVPEERAADVRATLFQGGVQAGEILRDGLERRVTVLTAAQAKGLEFDHVVVVEPVEIAGPEADWAYVYIAVTRATRTLTVLHSTPEPFAVPAVDYESTPPTSLAELSVPAVEPEGAILGARYTEALMQAKFLHSGQRRRGTLVPYLAHLQAVAALVLEDGGTEDEAIAGLLHDAAEDYGAGQLERIAAQFGPEVAQIVAAVTDPSREEATSWRVMKAEHLHSLESAGPQARRVALAEKLDNARALLRDYRNLGDAVWERMEVDAEDVLWYVAELADLFTTERPGDMAAEFGNTVERLLDLASQPA
jgi:DNA helicase IV